MSSLDAVVVVPGIMGSELFDNATGRMIWGVRDPRWYVRSWMSGEPLQALRLTDDERAGRYGRIKVGGLLRFPAFIPVLRGFDPYTPLVSALRRAVAHPDAVLPFAYDWRLPVAHNAALLAEAADRHLRAWRAHPAYQAARPDVPDAGDGQLVFVAHSMGGLLVRHLGLIPGATDAVRATLTLGTPFFGAPKVITMLSDGRGVPLPPPRSRVRDLSRTLPGLYDLLPAYRCLDSGTEARRLTDADIAALGADPEMARASLAWHDRIAAVSMPGHVQVVGVHQPTVQTITLTDGVADGHPYTCQPSADRGVERIDLGGDGTVPRVSAQLPPTGVMPLAQAHGAMARIGEAAVIAADLLAGHRSGPWLGAGDLGLDVPDLLTAGTPLTVTITGVADPPAVRRCDVTDLATGRLVAVVPITVRDGVLGGTVRSPGPGLYRVEAASGGFSAVAQVVMVVPG